MNEIEKILKKIGSNKVDWVKLGDVCTFTRGKPLSSSDTIPGDVPVVSGGQKPSFYHNRPNRVRNTITVAGSGASAGFVSYWEIPIWVADAFTVDPYEKLTLKYVYYFLKNNQEKIYRLQKGAGVPHVHGNDIAGIKIPVPKVPIQNWIVLILDSFTTLIDKMKQEVELRKKQMEYYRIFLINQILTDKVSISSFTKILRGRRLTKNMLSEDYTYPVFHGGNEPIGFYKEANREANSVMIINVGASAGTVGFCNSNFWSSDGCFCLQKNDDVLDKYVYYALKNKEKQIMSMVRNAGIPTLDASAVEKVEIPFPSLSTQRSIVSTLDAFEQYISKLERLITLREKQYAYYREKLLTFE